MRCLRFELSRGNLELNIETELLPFEDLVSIAERINPKRSFIFASKVIGRYLPTSSEVMFNTSVLLADTIPKNLLVGNVSVVSLSETALGLGALVHQRFKDQSIKSLNIFTSRHIISSPIRNTFQEPHSHLPQHYIYKSFNEDVNNAFDNTDTLVLVDDEITTGTTLNNLFKALKLSNIKRVILLSLTDWSGDNSFDWDVELHKFSLIKGTYVWSETSTEPLPQLPYNPEDYKQSSIISPGPYSIRYPSYEGLGIRPIRPELLRKRSPLICIYYNELLPQAIQVMEREFGQHSRIFYVAISSSPLKVGGDILSKIEIPGFYSKVPLYLYNIQELLSTLDNYRIYIVSENRMYEKESLGQLYDALELCLPDKIKRDFFMLRDPKNPLPAELHPKLYSVLNTTNTLDVIEYKLGRSSVQIPHVASTDLYDSSFGGVL